MQGVQGIEQNSFTIIISFLILGPLFWYLSKKQFWMRKSHIDKMCINFKLLAIIVEFGVDKVDSFRLFENADIFDFLR